MIRAWMQKLLWKLQGWMVGRYGYDELSKVLSIASLVCLVLSVLIIWFYPLALALLVWSVFRTYSKNIPKRQHELDVYRRWKNKVRTWFRLRKRMWTERKTHCYFKCKQCGAMIRVPKGRGEINVGCPRCKTRTVKKT